MCGLLIQSGEGGAETETMGRAGVFLLLRPALVALYPQAAEVPGCTCAVEYTVFL